MLTKDTEKTTPVGKCSEHSHSPIQFTPAAGTKADASIWEVRTEEQAYAFLP